MLAIGGFHVPESVLQRLSARAGRPPLAAWVGDAFDVAARAAAGHYDLIGHTDSGLLARHLALGLAAAPLYLPHAADPAAAPAGPTEFAARDPMAVFVANPTPHRRGVLAAMDQAVAIHGPGWGAIGGHRIQRRRVSPARVLALYGRHRLALNIRNEIHVLAGLNQRNFAPCLAGAALLTDRQPDLERCFEPGREVVAWGDVAELNAGHARLLAEPAWAAAVGAAGAAACLPTTPSPRGWRRCGAPCDGMRRRRASFARERRLRRCRWPTRTPRSRSSSARWRTPRARWPSSRTWRWCSPATGRASIGHRAVLPHPPRDLRRPRRRASAASPTRWRCALAHHDAAAHARGQPAAADGALVFDALEQARIEAIGANALAGVREQPGGGRGSRPPSARASTAARRPAHGAADGRCRRP